MSTDQEDLPEPSFRERLLVRRERFYECRVRWWTIFITRATKLLRPGTLLVSLAVAVYGGGTLANTRDWPSEDDWAAGSVWSDLLVVFGIVSLIGYVLVAWGYAQTLRRRENDESLASVCRTVARLIEQASDIPHTDIGVHIWVVAGPPGCRYLARRATYLPEGRRRSRVTWRRGKGVLGACWQGNAPVLTDLALLEQAAPSAEVFGRISKERRLGLTWSEFDATRHYRAVWATPVRSGPEGGAKLRGCLSVDIQTDDKLDALRKAVEDQGRNLGRALEVCERVLDSE